ncbi:MAG: tetratricopeptide repeat protein [Thermoanaerobaculales bacterium]|nr:tetratricopeptide repeat protein [Thermoanaerobaculales bacterium]
MVAALRAVGDLQLRWSPADPHGFVNRARGELITGEMEAAWVSLNAAIVRDPTAPELHRLAGMAARAGGRNEDALDSLATAAALGNGSWRRRVELTPEESDMVVMEGLRRRMVFYPRARSRSAISLARALRQRDLNDEGRELLESEARDPRVVLELARWDMSSGFFAAGEARLDALVSRTALTSAVLADAWAVIAMARDGQGDPEGAVAAAETALGYDPRSIGPYRVLASLAERRGDSAAALHHLRRAWGMNPTDVNLLQAVARTAERAGAWEDAKLALERAVQVAPENPSMRAALAEYQLRRGDFMGATVILSDALQRFPTDPRLLRLAERLRSEVARR